MLLILNIYGDGIIDNRPRWNGILSIQIFPYFYSACFGAYL